MERLLQAKPSTRARACQVAMHWGLDCYGLGNLTRAATRRSHNLLICPPSPAADRLRGRCTPRPQQRFAGSPRPATIPPDTPGRGAVLAPAIHVAEIARGGPTIAAEPPDPRPILRALSTATPWPKGDATDGGMKRLPPHFVGFRYELRAPAFMSQT